MGDLFNYLLKHFDDILLLLKRAALWAEGHLSEPLSWSLRLAKTAAIPEVLLAAGIGFLLACLTLVVIVSILIIKAALRLKRGRVFVSYHKSMIESADTIVSGLKAHGISASRLPFEAEPSHDRILANVDLSVRECDVLLCIPGAIASFVDHEVAMAFALRKPIIFVATDRAIVSLPNTAVRGYPVVSANELDASGMRTLGRLCSYIAGDVNAIKGACSAALHHIYVCLAVLVVGYFIQVIVLTHVLNSIDSIYTPLVFCGLALLFFLVPYVLFLNARLQLQKRISAAIVGKTFHLSLVPEVLTLNLLGRDIRRITFKGTSVHHHETEISAIGKSSSEGPEASNRKLEEHVPLHKTEDDQLVHIMISEILRKGCPRCAQEGKVLDVHGSAVCISFLVTHYEREEFLSCKRCARKIQVRAILVSIVLGPFGFPGLLLFPAAVAINFAEWRRSSETRESPSERLVKCVRRQIEELNSQPKGWGNDKEWRAFGKKWRGEMGSQ